ncbi:MAG: hypothetical protein ACI4I5_06330 [Acutalibacteraceae bacterium]
MTAFLIYSLIFLPTLLGIGMAMAGEIRKNSESTKPLAWFAARLGAECRKRR